MGIPTPKPFQAPIVRNICRALDASGRALVVMATGTGKTLTVGFAIKRRIGRPSPQRRVLVVAHMNAILGHLEKEFYKLFPDSSVSYLYDGGEADHSSAIVYANFATLSNQIAKGALTPDEFELIVVDEGHHAQAKSYRDTISFFKPKWLIGMTATPDRMDGRDITDIFGEPVVTLSLAQAMARKYVARVVYKLMSADGLAEEIAAIKQEIAEGASISKKDAEARLFRKATDDGFLKLMGELPETAKALIFVDSITRANDLAGKVPRARAYHSDTPATKRTDLLNDFKAGKITRLVTVDALNEGADVPDTDVIVFLRATESLTIFLQQLGRGLRLAEGKEHVTVYDFVGNVQRLKLLIEFLNDIKAQRKELTEEVKEPAAETTDEPLDTGPPGAVLDESEDNYLDLGDLGSIDVDFTPELVDVLALLSSLEQEFYPTLAEASAAVRRLGIRTCPEYQGGKGHKARYKEDLRLHSDPRRIYPDWVDWETFFGTNPYPTLAEASEAVQRLGIKTSGEYTGNKQTRGRYKEDPRLHSAPHQYYTDWVDWPHFLGTNPYPTLAEASAAVQRLGIKSGDEYRGNTKTRGRYKEDPRLLSRPYEHYTDWKDWATFLGTNPYPTLAEASAAVQRLGIKTSIEYRGNEGRYKEDPKLPNKPYIHYTDWKDWATFLGTNPYPTLAEASAAVQRLGIRSSVEYQRKVRYKEDPRLHAAPNTYYPNWTNWKDFLGTDK